jgi:nitroreductase
LKIAICTKALKLRLPETVMSSSNDDPLRFIFSRRSIRVFSPGEVGGETVTRLLEAAMAAPSAMSKDPWRFVVIRERHKLSHLAAALPGGKMLETSALAIAVCGDLDAAFENHPGYLVQDCSAAIENLLLAAHVLGLGGCWVGVYPSEESIKRVKDLLLLPAAVLPVAVIALGLPGEQPEARTRYRSESVHLEKW